MYMENVQDTIKMLDEKILTNKSLLSLIDGTTIIKNSNVHLKLSNKNVNYKIKENETTTLSVPSVKIDTSTTLQNCHNLRLN